MEIEVFRGGERTSSNGETRQYTKEILDEIVESFYKTKQLPHVIGHPVHNDPAWGWSKEMFRKGNSLYIVEEKVHPAFAQARSRGDYRQVSLSLFRPHDPGNPNPGKWAPRHVGWLGAMRPAIPDLAVNNYSIPEFAVHKEGDLEFLIDFSTPMTNESAADELKAQQAALDAERVAIEAEKAAIKQQQLELEKTNFSAFCSATVAGGIALPLPQEELQELYLALPKESVNFSSGETQESPRDRLKRLLGNCPKTIDFNNYGDGDKTSNPKEIDNETIGMRARDIHFSHKDTNPITFVQAVELAEKELGVVN